LSISVMIKSNQAFLV